MFSLHVMNLNVRWNIPPLEITLLYGILYNNTLQFAV